jgi:hypothetical protein
MNAISDIEKISDPIERAEAFDRAYREGIVPRQEVRRTTDASGKTIRTKAMVYHNESFEEAVIRESVDNIEIDISDEQG